MLNARQRAVVDALLPPGDPELPGALESGFEEFFARFEAQSLPATKLGFTAALWAAGWLSPFLIGRLPPLARLSPEDRVRALEALGKSRFYLARQLMLLMKAVVGFHYGAHPRVRETLGMSK